MQSLENALNLNIIRNLAQSIRHHARRRVDLVVHSAEACAIDLLTDGYSAVTCCIRLWRSKCGELRPKIVHDNLLHATHNNNNIILPCINVSSSSSSSSSTTVHTSASPRQHVFYSHSHTSATRIHTHTRVRSPRPFMNCI